MEAMIRRRYFFSFLPFFADGTVETWNNDGALAQVKARSPIVAYAAASMTRDGKVVIDTKDPENQGILLVGLRLEDKHDQ